MRPLRWLLICLVVAYADAVLKKKEKKMAAEKSNKPQELTVHERKLVKQDIKASGIVKEFKSYSNTKNNKKNFDGVTLAYITPWHYDGYKLAKTFKNKLNLLSPTWLSVRPMPNGSTMVIGLHEKREEWMDEVRKDGNVLILPRIKFEAWGRDDFDTVFKDEEQIKRITGHFVRVCTQHKFDGMVVEMWNQLAHERDGDLLHVISHFGEDFHKAGLKFVLVIPPPLGASARPAITHDEIAQLVDYVDYFSLMTYDFGTPQNPGPVAPLTWMRECVQFLADKNKHEDHEDVKKKLLLGLNFYGLSLREGAKEGEAIMNGEVYTNMIDEFKPKFQWLEKEAEHYGEFRNKDERLVKFWYPTLLSIQKRLDLAKEQGLGGVAIWEIGQGLDYFFDLL